MRELKGVCHPLIGKAESSSRATRAVIKGGELRSDDIVHYDLAGQSERNKGTVLK